MYLASKKLLAELSLHQMMVNPEVFILVGAKFLPKVTRTNDDYEVGDWILVEHGRWSRGVTMKDKMVLKLLFVV